MTSKLEELKAARDAAYAAVDAYAYAADAARKAATYADAAAELKLLQETKNDK